ncbi:MAG: hypothetical protein KC441_01260 [Anaerolineales bacterium]|nr:hypothetical protein [Anaerolineales bacterium]
MPDGRSRGFSPTSKMGDSRQGASAFCRMWALIRPKTAVSHAAHGDHPPFETAVARHWRQNQAAPPAKRLSTPIFPHAKDWHFPQFTPAAAFPTL